MIVVLVVLFAASRDALAKYYDRTGLLLGHFAEKEMLGAEIFNGNGHGSTKKTASQGQRGNKSAGKPVSGTTNSSGQAKGDKRGK